MLFSFITTTFNTRIEDFQKMCDSLKNQEYLNWNIIFADDGSDFENAKKYHDILFDTVDNNKIIEFDNHVNKGICELRDLLISKFENEIGEYIISLDSDDYIDKDFLSNILKYVKKYSPDIIKFNTLNFLFDEENLYSIQKKRKLITTTNSFSRIYKEELDLINGSECVFFKYVSNINVSKKNRLLSFLTTRIAGLVSTIYKSDFFYRNKLKFISGNDYDGDIRIIKNLDFNPAIYANNYNYNEVILNDSKYNYRNMSTSSVSKEFSNKNVIINKQLISTFSNLIDDCDEKKLDIKYMLFVYYLYLSYNNQDINHMFNKFFRKKININNLCKISKLERIAYRLSRNLFTRFIFGLITLIV